MDRSKDLPRGFYDHTGKIAEKMRMVVDDFYRCGKLYGFEWMDLSLVGYQETFLAFGSAAHNRGYRFTDRGGRKLMLCADSLATSLRVYRKKLDESGVNVMRLMGRVQVFRHRKRKYRNWSHLVLSAFNEDNALIISLVLINFANDFLTHYYSHIKYTLYFYGIYEKVFEAHEVSQGALHAWDSLLKKFGGPSE
jgi:histidyl-tRNA synthetase